MLEERNGDFFNGLLGGDASVGEVRGRLATNNRGETTLAEIRETAGEMGYHAVGVRISGRLLAETTVPVIAHLPPNHFVVFVGLGRGKGALMIDAPARPRAISARELDAKGQWNAVAVSRRSLDIADGRIGEGLPERPAVAEVATQETYGPLHIEDPVVDFGSVEPRKKLGGEVGLLNRGTSRIRVFGLKSSCACLSVSKKELLIEPGGRGVCVFTLDTTGLAGRLNMKIAGLLEVSPAEQPQAFELPVRANVSWRGKLAIVPARVAGLTLTEDDVTMEILIRRIGGEPLFLKSVRANVPWILPTTIAGSERNTGAARVKVLMHPQEHLGPFDSTLTFETEHPQYTRATLGIRGDVVSHIEPQPSSLYLGLIRSGQETRKRIILRSRTGRAVVVQRASATGAGATVRVIAAKGLPPSIEVAWDAAQPGVVKGKVVVEVNHPREPRIEIPYIGLVSSGPRDESE